jgi:hypothetical protein
MRESFCKTVVPAIVALALIPTLVLGQGCSSSLGYGCSLGSMGLSAYTGYFGGRRGADISFSASDQPAGSVQSLRQQFDLQGLSGDMLVPIRCGRMVGLAVGFGFSACFQVMSEETVNRVAATPLSRTWQVQPQGGNVHANVTLDLNSSLLGLVGFRYENFQTNFRGPSASLTVPADNPDSAALSLSAYIPIVGLVYRTPPSISGLNAQFGAVGFPFLLSSVDYRETFAAGLDVGGKIVPGFHGANTLTKGGFIDLFGDVSTTTVGGVQVGAYFKYEFLRTSGNILIGQGSPPPGTPDNDPFHQIPHITYSMDFQRRMWGVGGRAAISF